MATQKFQDKFIAVIHIVLQFYWSWTFSSHGHFPHGDSLSDLLMQLHFLFLSSSDDISSFKGISSLKTRIMNKIQEQRWPQP
ncbi:unnamed protein product, partial [Vitis vinifera]|uniref:Uncharacterized protein n=1 Tax=Vitis vinifera TaxID=29760 RepID=D7TJY0_VITVI